SWKSKARRISTALPITKTLATFWPRSRASARPAYQAFIICWPSRCGLNSAPAGTVAAAAASAGFSMVAVLISCLRSGGGEQQRLGEALELHRHLLERGHLFLELEDQVLHADSVQVLRPGNLLVQSGSAELGRGDDRRVGPGRAD